MVHTILVPLDGSERAEAILRPVEDLAGRYDATVVLLQVVEPVGNLEFCLRQCPSGRIDKWNPEFPDDRFVNGYRRGLHVCAGAVGGGSVLRPAAAGRGRVGDSGT